MKKIAVFGGTGRTGQHVLRKAIEQGYEVKALARNPQKSSFDHPNVEWIKGDVLDAQTVAATIADTDGVVSVFGHAKNSPKDVQERGTKHIVESMKANNVRRIISLSGGGLPHPKDNPGFADHLIRGIMRLTVPAMLNDASAHAEVLEKSGLNWTIARGPRLTDEPEKKDYVVSWVGEGRSTKLSRADLADFILKTLPTDEHLKSMPFITN
jgi:uncharacterized protein YbjT (DUF2867 family)